MKKVVDANYLRHLQLEEFLTSSGRNRAILTDYSGMEAYKGNAIENASRSMAILCRHPSQVIVLKNTRQVIKLKPDLKGMQRRMEDARQTAAFGSYCRALQLATKKGNASVLKQLHEHGADATRHLDAVEHDLQNFALHVDEMAHSLGDPIVRALRSGGPLPSHAAGVFHKGMMELAAVMFLSHPDRPQFPKEFGDALNTWVFRFAMGAFLLILDWIEHGGAKGAPSAKIRNDVVDLSYVTYATFFDGLLTKDAKMRRLHGEVSALLGHLSPQPW